MRNCFRTLFTLFLPRLNALSGFSLYRENLPRIVRVRAAVDPAIHPTSTRYSCRGVEELECAHIHDSKSFDLCLFRVAVYSTGNTVAYEAIDSKVPCRPKRELCPSHFHSAVTAFVLLIKEKHRSTTTNCEH